MKKTLLTILAIATILAITIIPASASSTASKTDDGNWELFVVTDPANTTDSIDVEDEDGTPIFSVTRFLSGDEYGMVDFYSEELEGYELNSLYLIMFGKFENNGEVTLYVENDKGLTPYLVDYDDEDNYLLVPEYESVQRDGHTFVKLTVAPDDFALFFGQEVAVESQPNSFVGSVFASEPVWGVILVALMLGCFAGGTAFGKKKNSAE